MQGMDLLSLVLVPVICIALGAFSVVNTSNLIRVTAMAAKRSFGGVWWKDALHAVAVPVSHGINIAFGPLDKIKFGTTHVFLAAVLVAILIAAGAVVAALQQPRPVLADVGPVDDKKKRA